MSAVSQEKVQEFYNSLKEKKKQNGDGYLAFKTRKDIAGAFHKALEKAVTLKMIPSNPAEECEVPKDEQFKKEEMHPLDKKQLVAFLNEIKGKPHEHLYFVDVFTGMREGEILGLTWDCVDFEKNTIYIEKQQSKKKGENGETVFSLPKNGKTRTLVVAPAVMQELNLQMQMQNEMKSAAGEAWNNKNLVFTNETGGFLSYRTVYDCFKRRVAQIGRPKTRFHDLRHTYAVMSIQNGDDMKTLSLNMGHYDAAFTLRVYGHSNDEMKQTCANNMQKLIGEIA